METIVICAEAPIALVVTEIMIAPLTPCCQASGKGCDGYIGCRACYNEVSPFFGDCWDLADDRGWDTYRCLLQDEGVSAAKADEIVAYAKEKAAATGLAQKPLRKPKCVWDAEAKTMRVVFE